MIKIATCVTKECNRGMIKEYCLRYFKSRGLEYQLQEFTSGESFFENDFPDILLLQTNFCGVSGLLIKEVLEIKRADTRVLFVFESETDMKDAFGRNVYGFLPEPFVYDAFFKCMRHMVKDVLEEREVVYCKRGTSFRKIYLSEVLYIRSYGRYTKLYLREEAGYLLSEKSMGDWCAELSMEQFKNSHRCYMVNLKFVKKVDQMVELSNGTRIPIAKEAGKDFKRIYEQYTRRKKHGKSNQKVL